MLRIYLLLIELLLGLWLRVLLGELDMHHRTRLRLATISGCMHSKIEQSSKKSAIAFIGWSVTCKNWSVSTLPQNMTSASLTSRLCCMLL